ncbi:MAG: universal stress protein [Deltaproteobacteria bacterium]|nr:universal stress protein [Deltaproteobacteria bacterium]
MAGPRKRDGHPSGGNPRRGGFKTLVVATDFTPGAVWASGRAALLPFAPGAKVFIFHVLPDGMPADLHVRANQESRRSLDEVVLPTFRTPKAAGGGGAAATPVVRVGMPYVEIIRESRARAADLIVLGRHGRRGIRDLFLGSTAERVIRNGSAPVLLVNGKPSHPYRRVLIALDLGDTSPATVELALRAAGPGVAEMSVLHACAMPFQGFIASGLTPAELDAYRRDSRAAGLSRLRRFLESLGDRGVRWRPIVRSGDPRVEILREAEKVRADLIVLGTHGRTGVSHALLGSVAQWIVRRAERDVLVARATPVVFDLP